MPQWTLVTGAAGFIGANVVEALNRRGQTDLLLSDMLGSDEKWRNLLGLRFEDLLHPSELLERLERDELRDIQTVIHLGACSSTTERDADFLLRNNYQYTRRLCQWCLARRIRFVYASSAATYGEGSRGYSDDDSVTPTLTPLNMYGYSKHLFDLWALKHGLTDRIVGLKYFNVFGPREAHKGDMRSVVHKAFEQIRSTGEMTLFRSYHPDYRDGEQKRDFVYVRDAAAVTLHFTDPKTPGGIYNCGTGEARTWNDLAQAVFAAMRLPPRVRYIDMPESLRPKYQYFTQARTDKLRAAGYVAPFTPLTEAVSDYVAFLQRSA